MLEFIIFYAVIGLGTALLTFGREMRRRDRVLTFAVWLLIWPVIWFQTAVIYLRGKNPEKCAWCGKTVGPFMTLKGAITSEADDRLRTLWRKHYENDCDQHPLYKRVEQMKSNIDSLHKTKRSTELLLFYLMAQRMGVRLTGESITVPGNIDEQVVNSLWFFGWVKPTAINGLYEMTNQALHHIRAHDVLLEGLREQGRIREIALQGREAKSL